ncbi:ribosomal RNA small subunit methyltransferase A [Patescibacteria group bacterium]|nr:ribosomal RNA small subunit methyltransferase A [Patescibacteria group bacterium]
MIISLTDIDTIKKLLKDNDLPALKKFGQNFLVDKSILEKIIESAQLKKDALVLEIGPGLGVLTKELAKQCEQVIAIEKDKRIIGLLKQNLMGFNNVEIIEGDILKFSISNFQFSNNFQFPISKNQRGRASSVAGNYKIVANLPYNIALPVIRKFIETENPPEEMILMLQKEVAEKLCSEKGSLPKIAVEFYAKTEFLFKVPKIAFYPEPKVDGAVIKIKNIQENLPVVDEKLFFKILKIGFSYPRKTILNNLSKIKEKQDTEIWLDKAGVDSKKRPENLTLFDWVKLCNGFQK